MQAKFGLGLYFTSGYDKIGDLIVELFPSSRFDCKSMQEDMSQACRDILIKFFG